MKLPGENIEDSMLIVNLTNKQFNGRTAVAIKCFFIVSIYYPIIIKKQFSSPSNPRVLM